MRTIEKYGKWTVTPLPGASPKRKTRAKPQQAPPRQYALDIGKAISIQMLAEQYGFALREPETK